MSNLLIDEYPLLVLPTLARKIGLKEAIVLQQFHYWLEHNKQKNINFYKNKYWTFSTYKKWADEFFFLGERTVRTTILNLEKLGLLVTGNFNKFGYDQTKWYTIDYNALSRIKEQPLQKRKSNNPTGKTKNKATKNKANEVIPIGKTCPIENAKPAKSHNAKSAKPIQDINPEIKKKRLNNNNNNNNITLSTQGTKKASNVNNKSTSSFVQKSTKANVKVESKGQSKIEQMRPAIVEPEFKDSDYVPEEYNGFSGIKTKKKGLATKKKKPVQKHSSHFLSALEALEKEYPRLVKFHKRNGGFSKQLIEAIDVLLEFEFVPVDFVRWYLEVKKAKFLGWAYATAGSFLSEYDAYKNGPIKSEEKKKPFTKKQQKQRLKATMKLLKGG
jgi:hypothetical protein